MPWSVLELNHLTWQLSALTPPAARLWHLAQVCSQCGTIGGNNHLAQPIACIRLVLSSLIQCLPPPQSSGSMGLPHHMCTACGADGAPLRPALLWMDMRSAPQAARVAATGDPALRINSNGKGPVSAEWMIPKALWIKENEPGVFDQASHICEYQVTGGSSCTSRDGNEPDTHVLNGLA
jgi:ribosomal protein L32